MKKILISICLFTVWITSYSQINCNGTSASTVNPTDKLAICNGNLQRTVTASQLVDAGIDTTKVGRIEQGRGTTQGSMYFNGVAWIKNDTSYIPRIGADNISGNLLSSQNTVHILGFSNYDNNIIFTRNSSTSLHSKNLTFPSGQSNINMHSADTGSVTLQVISSPFSRSFSVNGGDIKKVFRFNGGLASYTDNYRAQMTSDDIIPDIGKVKQLISDSLGTAQSTSLADGKIWIGDGTNTAFPRTLSGDVTVSNLGEATVDSINGITKSYYDPTSSIQTQLNSKQATISLTTTGAIGAASYSNPTLNIPKGYDELPTLGVIKSFTGSQWNVTTDWNTTNAGGSFTFGSNKLAMSGTVGTSTYTNYVYISSYISNLDVYSFDEDFTNKSTPSVTSYGFSVGIKSFGNQFQTDYSVKVGMSNADVGTLYIIRGGSVVATSNGSVGGTLNDTYNLKISQNKNEIIAILTCTSGSVANKSIFVKTTATAGNTYRFVQYQHGGDVDVTRLVYESQQVVGAEYLFEGNSITKGSSPTNINLRYVDILSKMCKGRFVVHAGNGNVSADALATVNEAISLAPKYVFIFIGTNDAGFGISTATYDSNMAAYIAAWTSAGYVVGTNIFVISILPRNDVSVVAYNNILKADYPTAYIDANTSFASLLDANAIAPRYDSGDQLHLNTLGHQDLAILLATQKPNIFVKKDVSEPNMLPLTFTRSSTAMYGLPPQTISPEANGTFIGMQRTSTFQPVANLTTNINYGTYYASNTGGTFNNYSQIGILNKITHNSTGTIGQAIPSINELQISSNGTISKAIANYNYISSFSSAAVASNVYSNYLGLPKTYSGALSGDTMFLSYVEDASAATSILLQNGSGYGSGTFTKRYGYYAKGGDHAFTGNSKFGIGTNAPVNRLDIEGGLAVGSTYSGTTAAPTNGAIIEGTVGIGTNSPTMGILDVRSTSSAGVSIYSSAKNTVLNMGSPTTMVNGEWVGVLQMSVGTSTVTPLTRIVSMATENHSTNKGTRLAFYTTNTGTSAISTEQMTLYNGNLGIGTAPFALPAARLEVNGLVKYKTYIVSGLPTCNSGIQDQYATVTDAVAPTYLVTVVGGGAIHAPVFCNGTNWVTH